MESSNRFPGSWRRLARWLQVAANGVVVGSMIALSVSWGTGQVNDYLDDRFQKSLKTHTEQVKDDVGEVKGDVEEVQEDVGEVKKDVEEVKDDVGELKQWVLREFADRDRLGMPLKQPPDEFDM